MSFSWFKSSNCCGSQRSNGSSMTTTVKTTIRNGQEEVTTTTTYSDGSQQIQQVTRPYGTAATITKSSPASVAAKAIPLAKEVPRSAILQQFEHECLEAHNRYRARHGSPPLRLSKDLSSFASEWAKYLANHNTLQHRKKSPYGENLFMASGQEVSGDYVVKSWYDEIKKYSFSKPGFMSGTGHFTQVVWMNSSKIGIGLEKRGNSTWVVANYDPPGNVHGQFQGNVSLPKY